VAKITEIKGQVSIFTEPLEFFRELVLGALKNQNVNVNEDIEYYLVSLLTKYLSVEAMQKSEQDPLAIQLHKAMISGTQEQIQLLKELGDFSLYISGFFSDSLNRKLVDVDYYIAMGGVAYKRLSEVFEKSVLKAMFEDLGSRFLTYTDILAEVSDTTFTHTHRDILRLYEKWLKTRSERVASLLKKEGLFPIDTIPTELI